MDERSNDEVDEIFVKPTQIKRPIPHWESRYYFGAYSLPQLLRTLQLFLTRDICHGLQIPSKIESHVPSFLVKHLNTNLQSRYLLEQNEQKRREADRYLDYNTYGGSFLQKSNGESRRIIIERSSTPVSEATARRYRMRAITCEGFSENGKKCCKSCSVPQALSRRIKRTAFVNRRNSMDGAQLRHQIKRVKRVEERVRKKSRKITALSNKLKKSFALPNSSIGFEKLNGKELSNALERVNEDLQKLLHAITKVSTTRRKGERDVDQDAPNANLCVHMLSIFFPFFARYLPDLQT